MGYYANGDEVKKYITKIPAILAILVLLLCFLIYYFYFVLNYNLSFILCGKTPYWSVAGYSPFELLLARGLLLIFATVTGFMLMRLTSVKPTFFSQLGQITLFIYVYHTFAIGVLRFSVRRGFLPQNEWFLILSSVFIMIVLISFSQIKFLNVLLNPISYFKERKNNN
jgi:fucose 4-O-acetylase-like acetyltransferase